MRWLVLDPDAIAMVSWSGAIADESLTSTGSVIKEWDVDVG